MGSRRPGVSSTTHVFSGRRTPAHSLPLLEDTRVAEKIRQAGAWILLPAEIRTSARRFEIEGLYERQLLSALLMNVAAIGWEAFFGAAPGIYRRQDRTQRLQLLPFLAKIVVQNRLLCARPRLAIPPPSPSGCTTGHLIDALLAMANCYKEISRVRDHRNLCGRGLAQQPAPVDIDCRAGDKVVFDQKQDRRRDLVCSSWAWNHVLGRGAGQHLLTFV